MASNKTRFVFPSELDGNSEFGPANITYPFLVLTFYNWNSQSFEYSTTVPGSSLRPEIETERINKLRAEVISTFIFTLPEQTITEDISHSWGEGYDWANLPGALASGTLDFLKKQIAKKTTLGDTAIGYVSASQGWGANDFRALLYDGMGFRRFEYVLKMVPKNKEDAQNIFNILNQLKRIITPDYKSVRIDYPAVCSAQVYAGNGKLMYRTMLSGVDQLNINYSPDGFMKTFMDGYPTNVNMQISLKELRKVTKDALLSNA